MSIDFNDDFEEILAEMPGFDKEEFQTPASKREAKKEDERDFSDLRKYFMTSAQFMGGAYKEIQQYQSKEIIPAKTGYPHIDEAFLGGLIPKNAMAIGSRSGVGKTFVSQKICDTVMNPKVNPQANEYLLVNYEFEMTARSLLLRRLSREMKMESEEFFKEQTRINEAQIQDIIKRSSKPNVIYWAEMITPEVFEKTLVHIAEKNKDKKLIIFKIDHIGLFLKINGDGKRTVDEVVAIMNKIKLKYDNVFFIVISQLNRDIEGRLKPKEQAPRMSDFYQSDELAHLCAVMVALNNPRRLGFSEYMNFPAGWYGNLDRFKPADKKTTFRTEGLTFQHILKSRDKPIEKMENTIYIEVLPGFGHLYNEGEVKYINKEKPVDKPKMYDLEAERYDDKTEANDFEESDIEPFM